MAEETTVDTGTEAPATQTTKPVQDTFSREYVEALRGESKGTRLELKAAKDSEKGYIAKLRAIIGLNENDEVNDAAIAAYQTKLQQDSTNAISTANNRLILAEIKNLQGYDIPLLSELLDKSKIKITDDGTVTGLTEAVEALATKFPSIKINQTQNPANPAQTKPSADAEEAKLRKAMGLKPL